MAYDIPAATMAQLSGSSVGAPDFEKFGADLTSGVLTGGSQKRMNAEEYANQKAFGPGDISGAMREQSNVMFKPRPMPGVVPDLSGKTQDMDFMPSQRAKPKDVPLAPSPAVALGGTAAAPAAAPTRPAPSRGGGDDDGPKAIDYTTTDPEYWRKIAESGRASEVWIPDLEKRGGAEEVGAVAKRFISGTRGSHRGVASTKATSAPKKEIKLGTRTREGGRRICEADR